MTPEREPPDKELTVEEQKALLDGLDTGKMATPPEYIVMEDRQPERFNKMMSEGQPEGQGTSEMGSILGAIQDLPAKLVERLKDD